MKLLFLDIDGCLNDHSINSAGICGISPRCVKLLNKIINQTNCKLVISSAWRYMILNGAMSIKGFEYLLRTHGINCENRIIGITREDYDMFMDERGIQILELVTSLKVTNEVKYVVVDDLDLGISAAGHPFVKTESDIGLTLDNAKEIIKLLNGD